MRAVAGLVALACGAGLAWGQGERPALRRLETGMRVEPVRVAPALVGPGGVERLGEWAPYGAGRAWHDTCHDYRVFDCYGDHDFDGRPDDAGGCNMGESRWHFGSVYCNTFYSNDMVLADDAIVGEGVWRSDIAWYWTGSGSGSEQCVVAVFMQESDPDACEADSFGFAAWMFDFGELEANPGGYYFAWLDISLIGRWELPPAGRGSYGVMFLTDDGGASATCAQPMLWSSPNNWGGDPDGPGAQRPGQLDDDNPRDLAHQIPAECYTYSFGICNDPLGGMAQFWGERADPPGHRADFNGDGVSDSRDVVAFLVAWSGCVPSSDCNRNDRCDSRDVLCFLDGWVGCR